MGANAMTLHFGFFGDKFWLGKRGDMAVSWEKDLENGIAGHLNILIKIN